MATGLMTYTQMLVYAIKGVEASMKVWQERRAAMSPKTGFDPRFIDDKLAAYENERSTLKLLYKVETGTDYE